MKYAIYMRVARSEQIGDGYDECTAQRSALKEYAKKNGLEVVEQYYDVGYSGLDLNRPGYQAMIAVFAEDRFDGVLTVSMDRLSRKPMAFAFPIKTIK